MDDVPGMLPADPPTPWVRPTTADRPRRWGRVLWVLGAVALLGVLALGVAWVQDRNGSYPGYRTGVREDRLSGRSHYPTNSTLADFEHDGALTSLGPWEWATVGGPWRARDGFARRRPTRPGPGYAVVDPGEADLIAQVEVFRPVDGAGLVLWWAGPDDHWEVRVADDRRAWEVVQRAGGTDRVVRRIDGPTQATNVTVTITGARLSVSIDSGVPVAVDAVPQEGATGAGMVAPTDETRFDQFAVLPG